MKTLRLLLLSECDRRCRGCCNKDWDLVGLPTCTDYSGYKEVILTGGEPLLEPDLIRKAVEEIRKTTSAQIFIYTAMVKNIPVFKEVLSMVDGITLTLHSRKDVEPFNLLMENITEKEVEGKSMRLNTFSTIPMTKVNSKGWKVKDGIRWIKDCPLPTEEVFMKFAK